MGQIIDSDDCPICVEFKDGWIFTYGDLVTLLLCFFILLFSLCKIDDHKLKQISDSFRSLPPGSPFLFSGRSASMEHAAQELEKMDMPDSAGKEGVEVSFSRNVAFAQGSVELSKAVKETIDKMLPTIGPLTNDILISGHTDSTDVNDRFPSNWEMSIARASAIATYLESKKIPTKRIQVAGFGDSRPRFFADTAYKRSLNRRVEILLMPEDMQR